MRLAGEFAGFFLIFLPPSGASLPSVFRWTPEWLGGAGQWHHDFAGDCGEYPAECLLIVDRVRAGVH